MCECVYVDLNISFLKNLIESPETPVRLREQDISPDLINYNLLINEEKDYVLILSRYCY